MNYNYEQLEGEKWSKRQVITALDEHQLTHRSEFFDEFGSHAHYDAQKVLGWLGY